MRYLHSTFVLFVFTIGGALSGCDESTSENDSTSRDEPQSTSEDAPIKASASGRLNWKRSAIFEQDLATALELPRGELCAGPDGKQCISQLYLVPLGGNDPFDASLYRPVQGPLVTTPSAVDRVMFSACAKRVALDEEASQPVVFKNVEFGGNAPSAQSEAVSETATTLFRRFHGRNPDTTEIELISRLTETKEGEPVSAEEFATTACYAVGSTTEFLFF